MVSLQIKEKLTDRAMDFYIILDDVSIVDLTFGDEYRAAVESKQVAQQEAERARYVVEKARQDKLEIIVKAEGESLAARKFNEQLKDDTSGNFLELRRIEAALEVIFLKICLNVVIWWEFEKLLLRLGVLEV